MLKLSNLNKKHEYKTHWPEEKKLEAVTTYLAVGNMRIVSATTGVGYQLLRAWKGQPWWKEYEYEIKNTRRSAVNDKLSKIVDKTLIMVEDRLENGDLVLNNKTGELIRKPVALRDISKLANDMMERQEKLEKLKIDESELQQKETMQDTLKLLAEEFAKFNGTRKKEIIDVTDVTVKDDDAIYAQWEEGLQEGVREVPQQTGAEGEQSGSKFSAFPDDEGGLSPKGGW